ncbi:FAD-dependent oxidoreductase [Kitasatospora acidiphila]|uniref:FAD-dependent oxidoreductase n=1 Tax=Kitasatospora acidiphila TaxID=2567942 RepID=UPI003C70A9A5
MTDTRDFTVAIIGGGIGGLSLAQGLTKNGIKVDVHERDRTPTDRLQGYRVHINPHGARALRACLPDELWQAFLATTGDHGAQSFTMRTEQLKPLLSIRLPQQADPARAHHSVSRITLRQVLLAGLDDTVHFGRTFTGYRQLPDGRIECRFTDGSTAVADLLVGADGGNSPVRHQYLPHAQRVDTGIRTIAGKYLLTPEHRRAVDGRLFAGATNVIPPADAGMFLAPHIYAEQHVPRADGFGATHDPGALFDNTASYLMWAYGRRTERFPPGLDSLDGSELRAVVAELVRGWHPDLRTVVERSDPDTVSLLPIRTSVPIRPWTPSRVTLLGDAIHAMTPMRGIGANTALRDADTLCRALTDAHRGTLPLLHAIGGYEHRMRGYGFAAVRASRRTADQFAGGSRVGRSVFKGALRTIDALPALRDRVFARVGEK